MAAGCCARRYRALIEAHDRQFVRRVAHSSSKRYILSVMCGRWRLAWSVELMGVAR
jgi:hypothetical protein